MWAILVEPKEHSCEIISKPIHPFKRRSSLKVVLVVVVVVVVVVVIVVLPATFCSRVERFEQFWKRVAQVRFLWNYFKILPSVSEEKPLKGFSILKTCLYNIDPLKPHFYIVKLGFTGVYIIFSFLLKKHRLWVLVRTAWPRRFWRVPTFYVLSKNKKNIWVFFIWKFSVFGGEIFIVFE